MIKSHYLLNCNPLHLLGSGDRIRTRAANCLSLRDPAFNEEFFNQAPMLHSSFGFILICNPLWTGLLAPIFDSFDYTSPPNDKERIS